VTRPSATPATAGSRVPSAPLERRRRWLSQMSAGPAASPDVDPLPNAVGVGDAVERGAREVRRPGSRVGSCRPPRQHSP
jgi:hypothetical protein